MKPATWSGRGDLSASMVLIVPLFLAYEIGVLFTGNVNGADVVTRAAYGALGRSTYLLVTAALAVVYVMWLRRDQRWTLLRFDALAPLLLEASIYALTLGALVTVVIHRGLGLGFSGGAVVNALGAGVYEEVVFRLGVFGGLVALLWRARCAERSSVVVALVVASALFALAHHAGPLGEPFTLHAFAFRCLAGLVFGLVFWFRSLAHAVYAHALYDVLVYLR